MSELDTAGTHSRVKLAAARNTSRACLLAVVAGFIVLLHMGHPMVADVVFGYGFAAGGLYCEYARRAVSNTGRGLSFNLVASVILTVLATIALVIYIHG